MDSSRSHSRLETISNETLSPSNDRPRSSNKVYPDESVVNLKEKSHKEDAERDQWGNKLDFLLSALSYSVGLGAVWRFPYLCYKNGGGAFLIPFFIFLILVGIPIMFLETAVGQYTSRGPILSWVMVKLFRGVGISMNIINHFVNIYYIMVVAWSLYFFILSFRGTLLWEKCSPPWASERCVDNFDPNVFKYDKCIDKGFYQCSNGQCYNTSLLGGIDENCRLPAYKNLSVGYWDPAYPSQDFWKYKILNLSPDMNKTGTLVWELVLALFVAWIICFLALFKGVKVSGKVVYFTALFPYLVLLILGIRGFLLDGAGIGIEYYIKPQWEKLKDSQVWTSAAVQVFFTLSLSYGGLVTLSSYNKFKNNILSDTLVLSISNFLTCILAGFVVFAYMGFLAKKTGLDIDKVVQEGQGLVFVVYPYAVTTIPASPVWSIMFFLMMLALGMGTMMASVETLVTSLEDLFPSLKRPRRKTISLALICLMYFLKGLLLTSQTGTYWVELLDNYSANYSITIIAIAECISVAWFYGVNNFLDDISFMFEMTNRVKKVSYFFWKVSWLVVTPLLLTALTIFGWIGSERLKTGDYIYPAWTEIVGNLISCTALLGLFGPMVYYIIDTLVIKKQPFKTLLVAEEGWRPLLDENKAMMDEARYGNIELHKF